MAIRPAKNTNPEVYFHTLSENVFVERISNREVLNKSILHQHDCYEIYFLIQGDRDYIINGSVFNLKTDCAALIPPYAAHKTHGGDYDRILVQFNESLLKDVFNFKTYKTLTKCFEHNFICIPKNYIQTVKYTFLEILKDYKNKKIQILTFRLAALLILLNDCISESKNQRKNLPHHLDNLTILILKYINENYALIKDIKEIADAFYINKFYLCHLFKTTTGTTIITYLNSIKIQNALSALKKPGSKTITDIAINCGFNSPVHFCNIFKKIVGASPKEYRKMQKEMKETN